MGKLTGQLVYLDSNAVIYAVEGYAELPGIRDALLIPMERGEVKAVTSQLTLLETLVGPRKAGNEVAEAGYRRFLTPSPVLTVESITDFILETAIEIRAKFGVKSPDAIHIATGIHFNCDCFITADAGWSRTGVKIVDPRTLD